MCIRKRLVALLILGSASLGQLAGAISVVAPKFNELTIAACVDFQPSSSDFSKETIATLENFLLLGKEKKLKTFESKLILYPSVLYADRYLKDWAISSEDIHGKDRYLTASRLAKFSEHILPEFNKFIINFTDVSVTNWHINWWGKACGINSFLVIRITPVRSSQMPLICDTSQEVDCEIFCSDTECSKYRYEKSKIKNN